MSFFDWLRGKPASPHPTRPPPAGPRRSSATDAPRTESTGALHDGGGSRAHRHARREQLYVAIREAMTRAGVLAARYKFKVLSLDQRGNEFLVMMDVAEALGGPAQLTTIETLVIQQAKARFDLRVPAVYWRVDPALVIPPAPVRAAAAARAKAPLLPADAPTAATPRYEPIRDDEVNAFKQALAAAAASEGPETQPTRGVQKRSGLRSHTLMTGFEDTEMPDSPASPGLSNTQYGDL